MIHSEMSRSHSFSHERRSVPLGEHLKVNYIVICEAPWGHLSQQSRCKQSSQDVKLKLCDQFLLALKSLFLMEVVFVGFSG